MAWLKGRARAVATSVASGREKVQAERSEPAQASLACETTQEGAGHDASEMQDGPRERPSQRDEWLLALKRRLHHEVISNMDHTKLSTMSEDQLRHAVREQVQKFCEEHADLIERDHQELLVKLVLDETFGLGPLEELMADSAISDILINGPKSVYVERHGRLEKTRIQFHDNEHVIHVVQRIAAQTGRRIDETCPTVDARLPDGSRLNAVIPPIAIDGPLVSIRRFGARPLTPDDLLMNHSITAEMLNFLAACVEARMNILVSGGTGSGKTTLLNCLSGFIPAHERVATIEDAAELQLQQSHVVRMESRPPNMEGEGAVTTYDLVRNALRMRPDRIIVGECRGPEAMDMLQAMNTGHPGSMTTVHANSPRDAIDRLEMMVGMAGLDVPIWIIRKQVASAIDIVVQVSRLAGGQRAVVKISEITGTEGDVLSMHDIFEFQSYGIDENGCARGRYYATGLRPNLLSRLHAAGCSVPPSLFERRVLGFDDDLSE
jgi:pilus assembly protein CpaF